MLIQQTICLYDYYYKNIYNKMFDSIWIFNIIFISDNCLMCNNSAIYWEIGHS